MKNLTLICLILIGSSCTILDKKIALYSQKLELKNSKKINSKKIGKKVSKEHCSRAILLIPTSSKNQFDVIEDLITENKEYNALLNAHIQSDMFMIPPLYMSVCHKIKGQLVKFE